MLLLLIDCSPSIPDQWEQTLILARELIREPERSGGRQVLLACPEGSKLARAAEAEGIPTAPLTGIDGFTGLLLALRRLIKKHSVDIAHVFDSRSLVACAFLRRFLSFSLVYTMHFVPQGRPMVLNRALNKADRVVFIGGNLEDELGNLSVAHAKTRVILPAFVPDRPRDTSALLTKKTNPARFVFVAACALTAEKDLGTLLQAMAYLQNMAIDLPPWEVRIVGDGPLFQTLLESAENMGVASRLSLLGSQDRLAIMDSADAVVSSSVGGAGDVPLILDAWSRRLPVACTALRSHARMGNDKEHFLLTEPGKPIPLAGSMLRLMTEPKTREVVIRGGEEALQRFLPAVMTDEYAALYREALAGDPVVAEGQAWPVAPGSEDAELVELHALASAAQSGLNAGHLEEAGTPEERDVPLLGKES